MTAKDKATRLWALAGLCSLGLCITACNDGDELSAGGNEAKQVELRFSASISDSPSTRAGQPPQPTITEGSAFAEGPAHNLGLFITREAGSELVPGSKDNMQSTLTRQGATQTWVHRDKTGANEIKLAANNGENILIRGYYPWVQDASSSAVPFDLSSTDPTKWVDLLYLSSPAEAQQILDSGGPIALKFSHAFCWVTVNLTKLSANNNVSIKTVSIANAYAGQGTIVNRGSINPQTGEPNEAGLESGPLKIQLNPSILLDTKDAPGASPAVFNFLVPHTMKADMMNSEIVIEVTTVEGSEEKVLTFPLSLTHLNNIEVDPNTTLYGFQKGKHNTYNLVYNNSAMNLSLSDWQEATITDDKLGEESKLTYSKPREFVQIDLTLLKLQGNANQFTLQKGVHLYHSYLGEVADKNNGNDYISTINSSPGNHDVAWKDAVSKEKVYPKLHVSGKYAAGEAQIPWKDLETGSLLAKQACVEYREGGYTDWRLPRISECYMMSYDPLGGNYNLGSKDFWSATEADSNHCYAAVYNSKYYVKKFLKEESLYVRCVRDADKDKPTK